MNKHRLEIRERLFDLIFENRQVPYWVTRGRTHRFGFDGSSGFKELARVEFDDNKNEFSAYLIGDDIDEYLGSSGDLTKARAIITNAYTCSRI